MIYLDSSCLLKLLLEEPESEAVRQAVTREDDVIVSALTRRPCATIGMPAIFTVARLTAFTWPPWTNWDSDVS